MNGLSVSIKFGKTDRDNKNLHNEIDVLNEWKDILEERYLKKFVIVNNSSDYTTLQPEGCLDIIRLKYSNTTKWIKIFITKELAKKLINDPRFETEKKKTLFYWKSNLKNDDISIYFDILDEAFDWLINNN